MKTLVRHGNSLALIIDKPILELLKIDADTPLDLATDGDALVVRPQRRSIDQAKLREALDHINERFAYDLKRLAE